MLLRKYVIFPEDSLLLSINLKVFPVALPCTLSADSSSLVILALSLKA